MLAESITSPAAVEIDKEPDPSVTAAMPYNAAPLTVTPGPALIVMLPAPPCSATIALLAPLTEPSAVMMMSPPAEPA